MTATHIGWLLFCPIRLADVDTDSPQIAPRWVPEWYLRANIGLLNGLCAVAGVMGFEPLYPLVITGEVDDGTPT